MNPPLRSSPVSGATYKGRYRLTGNTWAHVNTGEDDLDTEAGYAFGCYETTTKGVYDVWLEPLPGQRPKSERRFSIN